MQAMEDVQRLEEELQVGNEGASPQPYPYP